jgi:hypothetical protein
VAVAAAWPLPFKATLAARVALVVVSVKVTVPELTGDELDVTVAVKVTAVP